MKARIKRSGRVIDVFATSDSDYSICYKESQGGISYSWDALDFNDVADWEQRRYETASRMAAAIISNPEELKTIARMGGEPSELVAKVAVEFADELIKQLKEKENERR